MNKIKELDKQGMNPIGIGLGDDTVCGIYPTSIYLHDNDFDGLISFLKDCLLKPFYKSLMKQMVSLEINVVIYTRRNQNMFQIKTFRASSRQAFESSINKFLENNSDKNETKI